MKLETINGQFYEATQASNGWFYISLKSEFIPPSSTPNHKIVKARAEAVKVMSQMDNDFLKYLEQCLIS